MKILAAGWVACLLLVQDPSSRKPPVSVRVDMLFSYGADARWHTIILEVTNQTSTEQEFLIGVGMGWNDRAERRERFAPKVRKRLFFYLSTSFYGYRVQVAVDDASGRRVLDETQEISLVGRQGASGPRLLAALMDKPPVQLSSDYVARVIPEELFPDRWIGLDGVSLVIVRDYRLDALSPAQREALLEWVRRGGRMILYPGSNRDWLTSPAVQELAPVILGASEEVETILELEDFSPFRERTKFVRHSILNGRPLNKGHGGAVYFPCGRGGVVVVPFDLERAPFDSWPGAQDFRRVLAAAMPTDSVPDGDHETRRTDMPRLSTASGFIQRTSTATVNRLPPFGILAGLTLVYLIVIGPVNFLVLRRLRMTVRLVFTIPAISAVFLGVVILTGYVLRGVSTVVYEVSVLEAPSGAGLAIEHHYLSLFSPTARTYDIAFGAGETGFPGEDFEDENQPPAYRGRYGNRGGRGPRYVEDASRSGVVYDQTDRWTLKGVSFQQWQTRGFVGNAIRSMDGGVEFKIGADLQVTNRSPYTIRRGWAVAWTQVYQVVAFGDVPPGETRRFPLNWIPGVDRRYGWEMAESLEDRIIGGWIFECARRPFSRPFLLCVLDRLPDEISVDANRSGRSERLCLLQVGGGP